MRGTELGRRREANLAAASDRALESGDPVAALLLALEAVERDRSPGTLGQVQTALAEQYLVAEFRGHAADVTAGDLGPIRRRVVTASEDGTVRSWSADGEELSVLPRAGKWAWLSRDEQRILTLARSVASCGGCGVSLHPFRDHGPREAIDVTARIFGHRGRRLAEFGGDDDRQFRCAWWHPETSRLLVRHRDGTRAILDPSGAEVRSLEVPESLPGRGGDLFFSADGHPVLRKGLTLVVWLADGSAPVVLRTRQGQGLRSGPQYVAPDPRGELVATLHFDDVGRLWNTEGEQVGELTGHTYHVRTVQFSPFGETVLTAAGDGTARLWDRDGRQRDVLNPGGEVSQALFFGSDHRVLTSSWRSMALWNDEGRLLARLDDVQDPNNAFGRIADTAPGQGLVLRQVGRRAQLWRLGGVEGLHLRGDGDRTWAVACHPRGEILAGSDDGRVLAWDRGGRLLRVFHSGVRVRMLGIAVSPDGSRVVAGGEDGTVHAWDWHTGKRLWTHTLEPRGPMTDVAFLSSGRIWIHDGPARSAHLLDPERGTHELLFDEDTEVDDPAYDGAGGHFWSPASRPTTRWWASARSGPATCACATRTGEIWWTSCRRRRPPATSHSTPRASCSGRCPPTARSSSGGSPRCWWTRAASSPNARSASRVRHGTPAREASTSRPTALACWSPRWVRPT